MSVVTETLIRVWVPDEGVFMEVSPDMNNPDYITLSAGESRSKEWFGPVRFSASKEYMLALGNALIEASKP